MGFLLRTYVSTSWMSWYLDFSVCRTFFSFREKHWPGQSSLISLNHPSAFMLETILLRFSFRLLVLTAAILIALFDELWLVSFSATDKRQRRWQLEWNGME